MIRLLFCIGEMTVECVFFFFFFQAEDGIRDKLVTGVQTCALPISIVVPDPNGFDGPVYIRRVHDPEWQNVPLTHAYTENSRGIGVADMAHAMRSEIGRASCRERV